jgi:hypothetical protein
VCHHARSFHSTRFFNEEKGLLLFIIADKARARGEGRCKNGVNVVSDKERMAKHHTQVQRGKGITKEREVNRRR